jgi:hypothetical protein
MTVEGGRRINPIVYPQNSSADYWLRRAAMTRNKRLAAYPSGN